jgi:ligand-binding SRPBCC domain-containing protein
MRVIHHSIFPAPADRVWEMLQRTETLAYITRGMMSFEVVDLPAEVREGAVARLKVKALNLPAMDYEIRVRTFDPEAHETVTEEHGGMVRRWVHRITIEPLSSDRCLYTDRIDIDAGLMTPVVWAFAQVFYRIRQRRWLDLLAAI